MARRIDPDELCCCQTPNVKIMPDGKASVLCQKCLGNLTNAMIITTLNNLSKDCAISR
jgi:hypothetical protein